MSSIINKSNHPVEVKRIPLRLWALREEIEAAIALELDAENPTSTNIDHIKEFYSSLKSRPISGTPPLEVEGTRLDKETNDAREDTDGNEDEEEQKTADQIIESQEDNANASLEDLGLDQIVNEQNEKPQEDIGKTFSKIENKSEFQRIIPPEENHGHGFSLLADVFMDQMLVFTSQPYTRGQHIIVEFLIPNGFKLSGEVLTCTHFARNSKVISPDKPRYRIQCIFQFLFPNERSNLRNFLQSIEPQFIVLPKNIGKAKPDDDDDDFDDLGL